MGIYMGIYMQVPMGMRLTGLTSISSIDVMSTLRQCWLGKIHEISTLRQG